MIKDILYTPLRQLPLEVTGPLLGYLQGLLPVEGRRIAYPFDEAFVRDLLRHGTIQISYVVPEKGEEKPAPFCSACTKCGAHTVKGPLCLNCRIRGEKEE